MSLRLDPQLLSELKQYGALGAERCIQCGNCTAICSLSKDDDRFPRRLIRLAQLGLKDELLGSKELWLCFNCGDCSETCPQQAEPANLMAAARCYAVAHYAPFRIGELFCRTPLLGGLIATLMALFFGLYLFSKRQVMAPMALKLFGFIPYELIHRVGLAAIILIGFLSVVTILTMASRVARSNHLSARDFFRGAGLGWLAALWEAVVVQSLAQKRYREDCETPENRKAWWKSKWFVHAATMWGFLGLLLATVLDFLLAALNLKAPGTFVPIWYPTRLIGTLSGLLFLYGVSVLLVKRARGVDKAHSASRPSDWLFLTLLTLSGASGFIVEIALYLPGAPAWSYAMFIFHVAISMTLLLLLPFTKFAHAIYRTIALYLHALRPVARKEVSAAGAA
ncbi:MAG TPA: 4Fe-4S dicluster domain-containing protein [Anaerolineales bacterium]|nr:4Fe-4S dicluster domain-containing protein [Anaerolineales bacterium]